MCQCSDCYGLTAGELINFLKLRDSLVVPTLLFITETETMVIPKSKIERMKQADVSMMPEGLLTGLEKQDLLDLIAYLRSPSQVPLAGTTR